jgi:hypothetical protein
MLKRKECRSLPVHADRNRARACLRPPVFYSLLVLVLLALLLPLIYAEDGKSSREDGQFDILVNGKEIGREKFSIVSSAEGTSSNSTLDFSNPDNRHQSVRLETHLDMDWQYLPQAYKLQTNVDGQKGTIVGSFIPKEATFEYKGIGAPRKRGLLVGDHYIVLDTNVFHHFIFVARLFDFSAGKSQSVEAVIPQELDGGTLKVSETGIDIITVRGKKRNLHHLKVDTGLFLIDLWVDDQRILYKIALPAKMIEVVRS